LGIIHGAREKALAGEIEEDKMKEIEAIVESAETADFRPILYVIPYRLVSKLVKPVPISERAHPLSEEYKIERLPRRSFDMIDFERS
jgi:hypothetical protein